MRTAKLTTLATSALLALTINTAKADKGSYLTDYARVTRVAPIYTTITVTEPQRQCEFVRSRHANHQRDRHHHNRGHHGNRDRRRNFISGDSYGSTNIDSAANSNIDSASAIIVGGVVGGAIGHHLTESINGRNDAVVTLAGAAIGSAIAGSAARNQTNRQAHRYNPANTSHVNYNHRRTHRNRHGQVHHNSRRQNSHNGHGHNSHNNQGYERCVTTTVSRQERRHDGYNVTYVYRGQSFQTITDQDPGDRIRVRVQIKPH